MHFVKKNNVVKDTSAATESPDENAPSHETNIKSLIDQEIDVQIRIANKQEEKHGKIGQSGVCDLRMKSLIFDMWLEKVKDSEIFSPEDDIAKWFVTKDNLKDILETLNLSEYVT